MPVGEIHRKEAKRLDLLDAGSATPGGSVGLCRRRGPPGGGPTEAADRDAEGDQGIAANSGAAESHLLLT